MKLILNLFFAVLAASLLGGCSNFQEALATLSNGSSAPHPLKSKKDLKIEDTLTTGTWKYQRQEDDCADTKWEQDFHKNRYYKSEGSACLLLDAFSVEAESWHVKNQQLYIVNLSPQDGDDIILKYGIDFLDRNTLVLSSKGYKYSFKK